MNNVTFQDVAQSDGSIVSYAIIDDGNGGLTTMTKATYEATLAANSAPQG